MQISLPKLPGYHQSYNISLSPDFKRTSWIRSEKNANKDETIPEYILPRIKLTQSLEFSKSLDVNHMSVSHSSHQPTGFHQEASDSYLPLYAKLDKHVLRFYGYYKESVVESKIETYRVRKLTIFYFLIDGSISITEFKMNNSGIAQGAFLKRQRVLKSGGGKYLNPNDFKVGQEVTIFGRNILINECDPYTREFYENQGCKQPDALNVTKDNFEMASTTKHIPQKDRSMIEYTEAKLGHRRAYSQKQYFENDGKVLRFYVYSEIPYVMHYYLSDDSVEIKEVRQPNNGRDAYPLLLRRQKLSKRFSLGQPGQSSDDEYLKPHEIVHGDTLQIYGRDFKINGCDLFTQNFYKQKFNVDFPLGSTEKLQPIKPKTLDIPDYNGFGSEEDSLSFVNRLLPKVPKKDYFKWMDNQTQLRYQVKLNTKQIEDVNRTFIVTYFLFDNTLSVYEPEQRNSGVSGGKFLEKNRYKNVDQGNSYFLPEDLFVGSNIKINGFSFNIVNCDEFTKKWYFNTLGLSEVGQSIRLANTSDLMNVQSTQMLRRSV